ncbi:ribonuclease H [Colletotrichum spaethianum]|uniref:Ribonuclease H n=1 Tax=Colletotrichum spaethianum TaxID=700344 RepID=A0AA37PER9_9PEZI|nr:ribonuclease H [Colletotrichum spaethianum]GKT50869.1 ribonuclease H [Colletotrichum spaethianum]
MMGYDDDDGEGSRLFEHRASDAHRMVPRSELVVYDPRKQVLGLQMYSWSKKGVVSDPGSLVIYIDGACRNNGTPRLEARGASTLALGPKIEALVKALDILHEITNRDYSLSNIKIATDSEYLANAMSLWIGDWIENEGINARGHRVAHFETLKELHERLDDMTYGDDGGLDIMFWPIPREENQEADKLANQAFE